MNNQHDIHYLYRNLDYGAMRPVKRDVRELSEAPVIKLFPHENHILKTQVIHKHST